MGFGEFRNFGGSPDTAFFELTGTTFVGFFNLHSCCLTFSIPPGETLLDVRLYCGNVVFKGFETDSLVCGLVTVVLELDTNIGRDTISNSVLKQPRKADNSIVTSCHSFCR